MPPTAQTKRHPHWFTLGMVLAVLASGHVHAQWGYSAAPSPDPTLPRVLLIGDSISGGYVSRVRALLIGECNVDHYMTGNFLMEHSVNNYIGLAEEVAAIVNAHGPYAVIHFNDCGLHAWPADRQPAGDLEYQTLLRGYIDVLDAQADHLVWANTTCMTVGSALDPVNNPTVIGYNFNASIVMAGLGIPTVDLYGITTPHLEWKTDAFHWNGTGYQAMADAIAPAIRAVLPTPPPPPVPTAGVWAHYAFNSDSGDSSGNARHGTVVDVGTQGNSGITTAVGNHVFGGGAMDFSDERDRVSVPTKVFRNEDAYTIAFWAQRDAAAHDWHTALGAAATAQDFLGIHGSAASVIWRGAAGKNQRSKTLTHLTFPTGNLTLDAVVTADPYNGSAAATSATPGNTINIASPMAALSASALVWNSPDSLWHDGSYGGGRLAAYLGAGKPASVGLRDDDLLEAQNEIAARITTTVTGLAPGVYEVYAIYVGGNGGGNGISAALPGGTLANYTDLNATAKFDFGGQDLCAIRLGTTAAGATSVAIDVSSLKESTTTSRDLYVGIGYKLVTPSAGTPLLGPDSAQQQTFSAAADTAWHHYAFVADGEGRLDFYFDGSLVSSVTNKATGFTIDSIGDAYPDGLDLDMQGRIDEVWILDGAAKPAEIADLHTRNTPPEPVTRLRVFLLCGQSNADGRADTGGLPTTPVNLQQAQDKIDFYYRVEGGSGTLTTLRPGLSESSQFGPEITMGRRLANLFSEETGTRAAIIKYANGGTNLRDQWQAGGDATTTGDGPEYLTFQQTVSNGLAALAAAYPEATIGIEGMLWVQGESDTASGFHQVYEANLAAFVEDVRATYGADLPFVIMRLASGQTALDATGLSAVRAAQESIAAADPRTSLIDSDGFGLQSDNLHFDAAGQQQLGSEASEEILYLSWMLASFSTAQIDAGLGGPAEDPDHDSRSNYEEFLALSSPLAADDAFRAWLTIPFENTGFVHYPTSTYRMYAVEQYQPATNTWKIILQPERGTGNVNEHAISTEDAPTKILRVRCGLP